MPTPSFDTNVQIALAYAAQTETASAHSYMWGAGLLEGM